MKIDPPLLKL